jgi:hypothetical protein
MAMDFLKRLFGGGGGAKVEGDPNGKYFYIQPNGCDEVVRVRINMMNDLSLDDEGKNYWVHKLVRGVKCRQPVEADFYFSTARKFITADLKDGVLVDEAAYDAWLAGQGTPAP